VLGLLLVVSPARAQDTPPADAPAAAPADDPAADVEKKKEEAKVRFQRGIELVQNESWDAALAEFLVSRELFPTRVALKNAALCLRQLKRYVEALAMYNELIEKFGPSIPPDERKTIDDAVAKLKQNVGEVAVESDQPGSTVVIDGQQQKGETPMAAIGVNAGTHTVRVVKEGYEAYEEQILVAGGQRKTISAKLPALKASGRLVVREAKGKTLDVVVDGAVVGKTPVWQGVVAAGPHVVLLQGEGQLGTAPTPANVKEGAATNLTLSAVQLDAEVRIEPVPANARVDIDGVQIGNGVWEGRLPSGSHVVEVIAEGHLPFRKEIRLIKGEHEDVKAVLERDLSDPMWSAGFVPHLYVEAYGGVAMAVAGFGGDADYGMPFGFAAGARGGYMLSRGLGVELGVGYIRLKGSSTRTITAIGEEVPGTTTGERATFTSDDYEDETILKGPYAALSVSYSFLETTPITLRFAAGAARGKATFQNGGSFTGTLTNPCAAQDPACDPVETIEYTDDIRIPEREASIWVPFIAPEARFGYKIGKSFTLDLGVAFYVMLPPETPRTGETGLSLREGQRATALPSHDEEFQDPVADARPGIVNLPEENGFGTFFAIVPTIGGRFEF
jgi:hypothetical protein